MNMNPDDLATGVLRDRVRSGASMADVEPMVIDKSVIAVFQIMFLKKFDLLFYFCFLNRTVDVLTGAFVRSSR